MKKVWNKETYTPDKDMDGNTVEPRFYRTEDWEIEVDDDFDKPNFTTAKPHGLDQKVIPKQHFAIKTWVLDEAIDQGTLDGMILLDKVKLYEALEILPAQMAKFNTIMANESFKMKFLLSNGLDMHHPATIAALDLVDMDVDAIKRKMIKLKQ